MEELPVLHALGEALLLLAKLVFIVASSIAVYKKRSIATKIMLTGSIGIVLAEALGVLLLVNASKTGPEEIVTYTGISLIIQATTFIIFGLGLLLHILSIQKRGTADT